MVSAFNKAGETIREQFKTPSITLILISMALAAVIVVALQIALTQGFLRHIPKQYVLSKPDAFYVDNSWLAQRLAYYAEPDAFHIILMGGSNIKRAFSNQRAFERRLARELNVKIRIVNLAAGGQTYSDAISIMETIGGGFQGIVLTGFSISRFNKPESFLSATLNGKRGYLSSDKVDALIDNYKQEVPRGWSTVFKRYSVFLKDWSATRLQIFTNHEKYCLENAGGKFLNVCKEYYESGWFRWLKVWWMRDISPDSLQRFTDEQQNYAAKAITAQAVELYFKNRDFNIEVLQHLQVFTAQQGYPMVLIEQPSTELLRTSYQRAYKDYTVLLDSLSSEMSLPLWRDVAEVSYDERADFVDLSHLSPSGRKLFEQKLFGLLVDKLPAYIALAKGIGQPDEGTYWYEDANPLRSSAHDFQ